MSARNNSTTDSDNHNPSGVSLMSITIPEMVNQHVRHISSLNRHISFSQAALFEAVKEKAWTKTENITVIARFRPPNKVEIAESKNSGFEHVPPEFLNEQTVKLALTTNANNKSGQTKRKPHIATLDRIFTQTESQKQIFHEIGKPLIYAALEGYNSTLFAYGQTGSGKTYSMFGPEEAKEVNKMGLIPRSFVFIFDALNAKLDQRDIQTYTVSVQMLQIYNKQLLDLLNPSGQSLQIKTDFSNDSVFVQHLRRFEITSAKEALAVLIEAQKNRIVASHKLNNSSSRSHMLCMLSIIQKRIDGSSITAQINFGDLAGSENIAKAHQPTNTKGGKSRRRTTTVINKKLRAEAISINASLSALTQTISFLATGKRPTYRNSPLTHILKDSLGGNSKTTLLVCTSPHAFNRDETIRTMRFAKTAKEVKNKAKINENLSVKSLLKKIKHLESEITRLTAENLVLSGKLKNAQGRPMCSQNPQLSQMLSERSQSLRTPLHEMTRPRTASNLSNLGHGSVREYNTFPSIDGNKLNMRGSMTRTQSSVSPVDMMGTDMNINASPGFLSPEMAQAIEMTQQDFEDETNTYLEEVELLKSQLSDRVKDNEDLNVKLEEMTMEMDNADTRICELEAINQKSAMKLNAKDEEIAKLKAMIHSMRLGVDAATHTNAHMNMQSPNHNISSPPVPASMASFVSDESEYKDMGTWGGAWGRNNAEFYDTMSLRTDYSTSHTPMHDALHEHLKQKQELHVWFNDEFQQLQNTIQESMMNMPQTKDMDEFNDTTQRIESQLGTLSENVGFLMAQSKSLRESMLVPGGGEGAMISTIRAHQEKDKIECMHCL